MEVAVALLSFNRFELLSRTLASLADSQHPYSLALVDNGSTDGSEALVKALHGYINQDGNHTIGHGMNLAIGRALESRPDLVVFSADDYLYRLGWLRRLVSFWEAAPDEVKIVSCNWEPAYPWNAVLGTLEAGGETALIREMVPGSNWTFRACDWPLIGPVRETTGQGEDGEILKRLRAQGFKLGALDLSIHIGEQESAWGNRSWTIAKPLDLAGLKSIK